MFIQIFIAGDDSIVTEFQLVQKFTVMDALLFEEFIMNDVLQLFSWTQGFAYFVLFHAIITMSSKFLLTALKALGRRVFFVPRFKSG